MKLVVICLLALSSFFVCNPKTNSYTSQDPLQESIERGSEIYTDFCMSCHLPNGKGVENVYPPLAKSDYLMKTYNSNMAALGLSDDEVADVMNYITNSWGNKNNKIVTEAEVSSIKK